jgi:hypothetical protein
LGPGSRPQAAEARLRRGRGWSIVVDVSIDALLRLCF